MMSFPSNGQSSRYQSLSLRAFSSGFQCMACLRSSSDTVILSRNACPRNSHLLCLECVHVSEFCVVCTASEQNADKPRRQEAAALVRELQNQQLAREQAADRSAILPSQPVRLRSGRISLPARDRNDPASWSTPRPATPECKAGEGKRRQALPSPPRRLSRSRSRSVVSSSAAIPAAAPAAGVARARQAIPSPPPRRSRPRSASAAPRPPAALAPAPVAEAVPAPAPAPGPAVPAPALAALPGLAAARDPLIPDVFASYEAHLGWKAAQRVATHGPLLEDFPLYLQRSIAGAYAVRACKPFIAAMERKERSLPEIGRCALAMLTAQAELLAIPEGIPAGQGFKKALLARIDAYTTTPPGEPLPVPPPPAAAAGPALGESKANAQAAAAALGESKASAPPAGAAAAAEPRRKPSRQVRRAVKLARKGYQRRAIRMLLRENGLADASLPAVQQELLRLLPVRDDPLPKLSEDAPYTIVNDKEYRKRIFGSVGSAPGPSGQTAEFLLAVWSNPFCRKALCLLFDAIRNGELPESCMPAFRASRLVPLNKSKASDDWELCFDLECIPLDWISSPLCFEVVNSQTGASLGRTECTTDRDQHTFEVKIKLPQALVAANTALSFNLLRGQDLLAQCSLGSKDTTTLAAAAAHLPLAPKAAAAGDLRGLISSLKAIHLQPGIRPIQVGEVATRIAIGTAYFKLRASIAAAFPHIQLGLGVPGGCEAAFHDVMLGLDSGLAVADLDFENAFGLRSSSQCWKSMAALPALAPFLRPFHALYRQPAPVFVTDGRGNIIFRHASTSGPRQGCILGSLSFCASVQSLYAESVAKAPGLRAVAIIDNFSLIGPVDKLAPAVQHVIQQAPAGGGKVRRDKSKLHYYGPGAAEETEWARQLGLQVNQTGDDYLGGVIGNSLEQRQRRVREKVERIVSDMRKLENPDIPNQIALLWLVSCIPSRFEFLARLCSPEVLRPSAQYLDNQMFNTYCRLAGIHDAEATPALRATVFSPISLGGRGLRSAEALLERSFLGSQALSAGHLQPLVQQESAGSARLQSIAAAMERVKATVSEELADELLPSAAESFTPHFAEGSAERRKEARELQQSLNAGAKLLQDEKQLADAKAPKQKALLQACRARGASLAFTTAPHSRHLALSKQQVAINERLRLGLPPERSLPLHCHCGQANGQYPFDPWHSLSCQFEKGSSITTRHDDVKYALAHWVTQLGGRVKVEPRGLEQKGFDDRLPPRRAGRRGRGGGRALRLADDRREGAGEGKVGGKGKVFDLFIWGLGQPIALDVTVVHPLAPSHVAQSAADPESVLEQAEAEKHREYDGLADQVGAKFFAFAVETTGRLGNDALAFIRHLIQEGARFKHLWAPKEVVHGIYRTVAIAIARGNANIVQSNLAKSRLAEWRDG